MDPHHRKIDLQSAADFHYLNANVKSVAQQRLDEAIPPQGEDAFRTKVQELVKEYIHQTFSLALPSISVNGLDASPSLLASQSRPASPSTPSDNDANYEPYDPRLAARLRELYAQMESESTRVAELRRDAPGAAARAYMEILEADLEAEKAREVEVKEEADEQGQVGATFERAAEMERMWTRGTETMVGLERIPVVLEKMERARMAAEVVEGAKSS